MIRPMKISQTSAWTEEAIGTYLSESITPIRLAVQQDDYPLLCSVWFNFDPETGSLTCASHASSALIRALKKHPRCSFEVAPNEPPYKGVRGKGEVSLKKEGAESVLSGLISRYLGTTASPLANWLLSRSADEYVIEIKPVWVTAWDYSPRMDRR